MDAREDLLAGLADDLVAVAQAHPLRVAVDGITAAGKSTLAADLARAVEDAGRPALHLSTDDHHHLAVRRRRDPDRARGYYRDAYDLATFRRVVLDPLGPGGDRLVRTRTHDLDRDVLVDDPPVAVAAGSVLLVDGTFLQVPELAGGWDVVLFLRTSFAAAEDRAARRDAAQFGGEAETRTAYRTRYHAACRRYLAEVDPETRADVVIDVEDPARPRLVRAFPRPG